MQGLSPINPLLMREDVAGRLRVSLFTLDRLVKAGALPQVRLGKYLPRFDVGDVTAYLRRCKSAADLAWPDGFTARMMEATGERVEPCHFTITKPEVMAWLGVKSPTTIERWRRAGRLPSFKLEPLVSVRYDVADVQALIEQLKSESGSVPDLGSMPVLGVGTE